MKKFILILAVLFVTLSSVQAQWWAPSAQSRNSYDKDKVLDKLIKAVPVPEIMTGQERKMVAWRAKTFDVENKLGFVYVFCSGVGAIGYYTVNGKVASLNSFLVQQDEIIGSGTAGYTTVGGADIDGTWGFNIEGVFFRTTDGAYVELPTNGSLSYMYFDRPIPALKVPLFNVTMVEPAKK